MQDKIFKQIPTPILLHAMDRQPHESPLAAYVIEELPVDLRACVDGPNLAKGDFLAK